jgi:transposase-like protein
VTEIVVRVDRLTELAETIRRESSLAAQAADEFLQHALAVGDALIEAKTLVPSGEWTRWMLETSPTGRQPSALHNYMRLAHYRDEIDPSLSVSSNIRLLAGLPGRRGGRDHYSEEMKAEALERLKSEPITVVSKDMGITAMTLRAWRDPEYAAGVNDRATVNRRQQAARRAPAVVPAAAPLTLSERARKFGPAGRVALTRAVRGVAAVETRHQTREALLDLIAVAQAWVDKLEPVGGT